MSSEPISAELIETVCTRLNQNKRVRRSLPDGGRLHIDRQVPFLCVYRRPPRTWDEGTERLVMGEASYVIASGNRQHHRNLARLVTRIMQTLAEEFGAFLLVELWATNHMPNEAAEARFQPAFRILAHPQTNDPLARTLTRLENSLKKLHIAGQHASVESIATSKLTPPGMGQLISNTDARKAECRMIGLEVQPIYRDEQEKTLYPIVLQNMQQSVARSLKQTFYTFVRTNTSHRPTHYHALGRQALVKAVWEVDRQLADISNSFDFLLLVTPTNADAAWASFKRTNFKQEPAFRYRPLPVDPVLLKRNLYDIRIERVEDPTLAQLFYEKQQELDQQISMLLDRNTPRFLYGSLHIFGKVDQTLLHTAQDLLHRLPPRSRDDSQEGHLDAKAFAERANREIDYYRQSYPALSAQVFIRDDINAGLMVSHGNLLIGKQTRIPARRAEPLLHHELGTHMLTYFNGLAQPLQQLHAGLAGYEELQEGLAVLAEHLGGNLSRPRMRLLAGRVVAAHMLTDGASFSETFASLTNTYQFDQRTAFTITMRIYRGGGLTKDAVYLRGLLRVLDYLKNGGELAPLFVGKIAAAHIPIIRELQWRNVLKPAPLQPRYMQAPQTTSRLENVRQGCTVLDLVKTLR